MVSVRDHGFFGDSLKLWYSIETQIYLENISKYIESNISKFKYISNMSGKMISYMYQTEFWKTKFHRFIFTKIKTYTFYLVYLVAHYCSKSKKYFGSPCVYIFNAISKLLSIFLCYINFAVLSRYYSNRVFYCFSYECMCLYVQVHPNAITIYIDM